MSLAMFFLRRTWNTFFPKKAMDPEFGILTLDWTFDIGIPPKPPEELWIGKAHFAPLGHTIAVVFAKESDLGSTPLQRERYHSVEVRWELFRDDLARQLRELIREWYGDAAQTETPSTEEFFQTWVRLNGIDIRGSSPDEAKWADASFEFSVLPAALTKPALLEMQDHNPAAQLYDDNAVIVAMT